MMNFAPQSGGCHRIMPVFCDSQMLGFQMHLMQAQLCNYALKGLEDSTVMTGQLPVSAQVAVKCKFTADGASTAQGYNSKFVFFFFSFFIRTSICCRWAGAGLHLWSCVSQQITLCQASQIVFSNPFPCQKNGLRPLITLLIYPVCKQLE